MRQRANKRAKPQPPGFFTGSRGCGCCQPPPPPPPPRSPYGYYYRRGDIQRSPCDWFCQDSEGNFTGQSPPYRYYFEHDSFENVTSVAAPCQGSTATLCDNSNGTFAVQYAGSYESAPYANEFGGLSVLRWCGYLSTFFQGVFKFTRNTPALDGCALCNTAALIWKLYLLRYDWQTMAGGAYNSRTDALLVLSTNLELLVPLDPADDMGWWSTNPDLISPITTGPTTLGPPIPCSSSITIPLVYAEYGYGTDELQQPLPMCCTGASNAIEIVPL